MIEVNNVSHYFSSKNGELQVLDNLSFSVPKNGFSAIVGPSGCGKSTVTKLIAGLMKPRKGSIILNGEAVQSPRSNIGMAFQNPVLLEWRNILKNVMLPLEIVHNKLSNEEKVERARELLALVGLSEYENSRPSELSGGMRQRASLCRSLIHRPEVLILDEPFGALDAFTREDLWLTMNRLREKESFTCLIITHDIRESIFLADEVVVLSGRPATNQFSIKTEKESNDNLDQLYTPHASELLNILREQIGIARRKEMADK
ncbi:MAG: Bicarbonate transport ATP-binding protein CmpD [SAR116 cluster bacterium]|nr:MAG: Bicarbonate transport ATP-binding protein CmpD [SAR116 cluster bacterium]